MKASPPKECQYALFDRLRELGVSGSHFDEHMSELAKQGALFVLTSDKSKLFKLLKVYIPKTNTIAIQKFC